MGYGHGWTKRGLSARFGSNFREPLAPTNLPQADLTGRVRRPAETPPRGGPRVRSAWVWKTGSRFNPPHHTSDGLCATADLGSSFYSSFGGLTKKFRTNLGKKRCKSSFYSSLGTPMKKFRTIAGQRLHATYPAGRSRRSFPDDKGRMFPNHRPRRICLRHI